MIPSASTEGPTTEGHRRYTWDWTRPAVAADLRPSAKTAAGLGNAAVGATAAASLRCTIIGRWRTANDDDDDCAAATPATGFVRESNGEDVARTDAGGRSLLLPVKAAGDEGSKAERACLLLSPLCPMAPDLKTASAAVSSESDEKAAVRLLLPSAALAGVLKSEGDDVTVSFLLADRETDATASVAEK